jgi:4-hydroxy-tetrahydrodipicolinate reductase
VKKPVKATVKAPVKAPIRICICGVGGRMGARILAAVRSEADLAVTGATERPQGPHVGQDAGLVAGSGRIEVQVAPALDAALGPPGTAPAADVVIDFTAPAASLEHAAVCARRGVALVIGTTGFSARDKEELAAHGRKIPILLAPNMSVGVNVLFRLVAEAARALGAEYDCEIVDLHHRAKKDAPSGTALRLAEVAAGALHLDASKAAVYERHGDIGARKPGTIGVQTLRGGDAVGDHTVFFLADGERLELTHRATSRDNFARGAVRGARFVAFRAPGLYDMQDVLGLA